MSRRIEFMCVPSHVGIQGNEKADQLTEKEAQKSSIDLQCTFRRIKTLKKILKRKEERWLESATRVKP